MEQGGCASCCPDFGGEERGKKKQNEEKAEKVGALKGYGPSLVSQRASPLLLGPDFSTCASIPARSTAFG